MSSCAVMFLIQYKETVRVDFPCLSGFYTKCLYSPHRQRIFGHWNINTMVFFVILLLVRKVNFLNSTKICYLFKQDAQLSQRDRAAVCVIVFAKSRTLELGD